MNKFIFSKKAKIVNCQGSIATFRKRIITRKRTIISVITIAAALVIAPVGVHAVQNIFTGFGQITDIQFGGANIDKVVYQGETIWERDKTPTMQALAGCPSDRTMARDARDDHTYWVRRIGDLCWMETNLAYAGGGTNTYGDVTPAITQGSASSDQTYTAARYFIPTDANVTSGTTAPSLSTDGGATSPQYGYLYNWCAALNGQSEACTDSASSQPNQSANGGTSSTLYNICPLGWRLPTGGSGGEFESLNNLINNGSTTNANGLFTDGLYMKSGYWTGSGVLNRNVGGYYWSSTTVLNDTGRAYDLLFNTSKATVNPAYPEPTVYGISVRCVKDMPPDMQTITATNCPLTRTIAVDARDGATYWVRKVGSLCWMETNLAYAGGGTNTFGDVTPAITQGSTSNDYTYDSARYFVPTGSNRTTGTTDPSTSTSGTGQYGYLYNWCAAMNSQSAACQGAAATQPNQSVNGGTGSTLYNICPAGWRLPTGEATTGEFTTLNTAINSGSTSSPSGLFTNGLYMYSGYWYNGSFASQGSSGYYWSSTVNLTASARSLYFSSASVSPANVNSKRYGFAVRCVAP
jgi:uncharacterized protein (TIGR02145 family)